MSTSMHIEGAYFELPHRRPQIIIQSRLQVLLTVCKKLKLPWLEAAKPHSHNLLHALSIADHTSFGLDPDLDLNEQSQTITD